MIYKRTVGIKTAKIGVRPLEKYRITITKRPNWFGRIFGVDNKVSVYEGDCTVWYKIKAGEIIGRRAGTNMEWWLCEIWETIKDK